MKKCIFSSLLIHVVFWSANGLAGEPTRPLPDPRSFYTALKLAGKETDPAALKLERFFQSTAGQLAQIIPVEEQYPNFELHCPDCGKVYATDSSSRKVQDQLKSAFKRHKSRHKEKLYCCPICEINYFQNARALKIHMQGRCGKNLTKKDKENLLRNLKAFKTDFTRAQLTESIGLQTQQRSSKYK